MFSMTAFGNTRITAEIGTVAVEYRSVNNRFLDISLRLPEELRSMETALRTQIGQTVKRGKVEMRLQYTPAYKSTARILDDKALRHMAELLQQARQLLPDTPAPSLEELLRAASGSEAASGLDVQVWEPVCLQASEQALHALQENRQREGARLALVMLEQAEQITQIVETVAAKQPELLAEHQEKLARKLRDALQAVSPDGFAHISGAELSARIAQESLLFSLRVDVAEELTRLRAHGQELRDILAGGNAQNVVNQKPAGSSGKRLDFLFQEMQREANTLGSKSASVLVTRAAMDLKLLIEQLREQAQNIA